MVGLSKATLLAIGLSSFIILTSFVWTQAAAVNSGWSLQSVKIMSNNDMQDLLKKSKGKTLIQVQNKVGTIIEVECKAKGGPEIGRTRIAHLEALAFYFSPLDRQFDQIKCNVYWQTVKRINFEVYNQAGLLNNANTFEVTKEGVSRNGRKIQGWS